ncbi:MAG: NAD-dependent epimerase/dehydratase family protein [Coriobacteriia bacterium]|nr:NAD-dependent epimerase/dehydratase family protein [Coriobacteriia bacterium]MBN2847299.1 NAD-dependent epimerase/dehydratase family protein [Coriobacteriia bacterium]
MRVVVTGGAGFIGGNLVYALLGGGWEITVIDDLSTGSMDNVHPATGFRRLDVRDPRTAEAIIAASPDIVVHLAAQVSVAASIEDPEFDREVNVEGTRLVAEAAVAAGAQRVLFASSAAVYGEPQELPLTEDSPVAPAVPYGASKLAAESVLAEVLRPAGVDFAALRFANVYGPRQRAEGEGGVVAEFASRMTAGISPVIFGSGTQTRDFIYVADIVSAIAAAASHEGALAGPGPTGPAYNISTGIATSVNMLAEGLRVALRYPGTIERADARDGDVEASVLSPGKAASTFGWKAAVELQDGLDATGSWFARQR